MKLKVSLAALFTLTTLHAHAQVPVIDAEALALQTEQAATQAWQYALEVKGWVDVAMTYANAVENTVALPMDAIGRVQGYYWRAQAIADQALAITGATGTTMQRVSMLKGVGRNAGNMPTDAGASFRWWKDQASRQLDDDIRLLGLEEERQQLANEMTQSAVDTSADAVGRMAATQAQSQVTASVAAQLAAINSRLAADHAAAIQREAMAQAAQQAYDDAVQADLDLAREAVARPAFMNPSPAMWGRSQCS